MSKGQRLKLFQALFQENQAKVLLALTKCLMLFMQMLSLQWPMNKCNEKTWKNKVIKPKIIN